MLLRDCQAVLGLGVFFILLGTALTLWNRKERNDYYESLAGQRDLREFITHRPQRFWLSAWRIGGWTSLIIGIAMAVAGGALWLVLY